MFKSKKNKTESSADKTDKIKQSADKIDKIKTYCSSNDLTSLSALYSKDNIQQFLTLICQLSSIEFLTRIGIWLVNKTEEEYKLFPKYCFNYNQNDTFRYFLTEDKYIIAMKKHNPELIKHMINLKLVNVRLFEHIKTDISLIKFAVNSGIDLKEIYLNAFYEQQANAEKAVKESKPEKAVKESKPEKAVKELKLEKKKQPNAEKAVKELKPIKQKNKKEKLPKTSSYSSSSSSSSTKYDYSNSSSCSNIWAAAAAYE